MEITKEEKVRLFEAWLDGKVIQFRKKGSAEIWENSSWPVWTFSITEYRVKPEPKTKPYDNEAQIYAAAQIHGWYVKAKGASPAAASKLFIRPDSVVLVGSCTTWFSFYDLWASCEWKDGTPCGVIEEETNVTD